jgi:hypothetical protein
MVSRTPSEISTDTSRISLGSCILATLQLIGDYSAYDKPEQSLSDIGSSIKTVRQEPIFAEQGFLTITYGQCSSST